MSRHLTDEQWQEFQSIPEQGYSHRHWIDYHIEQARAAERAEALREVRLAWQWGGWPAITEPSKTPDQMRRVFAVAQAVTDWLTQHMREEKRNDRDSG